jgi:hypothetical protein
LIGTLDVVSLLTSVFFFSPILFFFFFGGGGVVQLLFITRMSRMYTKSGTRNPSRDPVSPNSYAKFEALGPIGPRCRNLESYGEDDDEKKICGLSKLDRPGCVVISLGSNGQFGFEEAVVRKTMHCVVHTYDCTGFWELPEHLKARVTFHRACIASESKTVAGREYLDYNGVLRRSGLVAAGQAAARPPAHLKMDIEGWEYDVMRSIFMSQDLKMFPQQVSLEIHWWTGGDYTYKGVISAGELLALGSAMYRAGYVIIDSRSNLGCHQCIELTLFRVFC